MARIINGKDISKKLLSEISETIKNEDLSLTLAVILVGTDPASKLYVNNKVKVGQEIGVDVSVYNFEDNVTESELLAKIDDLNHEPKVNGILVQLPLPAHIKEEVVVNAVSPDKDVDGFTLINSGRLMQQIPGLISCTPAGIIYLLESIDYEFTGKHAVIIGRSQIVGLPISKLLLDKDCTVTITHSKTKDLKKISQQADLLIVAIGKAEYITEDFVKEGATVIDVGINRDKNQKLVGDVDFESVLPKVEAITPVPQGVGPMTIAMLMKNLLKTKKEV